MKTNKQILQEFDKKFPYMRTAHIKDFLFKALKKQREEMLKEIEGIKSIEVQEKNQGGYICDVFEYNTLCHKIDDIIKRIKEI